MNTNNETPMNRENSILALHMGEGFDTLSPLLQDTHIGRRRLEGIAKVQRGNFFARVICSVFGFPEQNSRSNLSVDCEHSVDAMVWKRNFDGQKMESHFAKNGSYLVERLGPLAMSFKAIEQQGELHYQFIKTRLFGMPLPKIVSPQIVAFEKEAGGCYQFSVEVKMFPVGLVIAYAGELQLAPGR